MDPYPRDGVNYEKALIEFTDIIEFAKQRPDDVTLLLGNHDAHYCGLSLDLARYDYHHAWDLHKIYKDNEPLFQGAFLYNNALFTHAGISKEWLAHNNISENIETLVKYINSKIVFDEELRIPAVYEVGEVLSPISDIGKSRGGYLPSGGPLWCDVEELSKNPAFDGALIQIVGHSQLIRTGSMIIYKNFYCCDSRSVFIWDGEVLKVF